MNTVERTIASRAIFRPMMLLIINDNNQHGDNGKRKQSIGTDPHDWVHRLTGLSHAHFHVNVTRRQRTLVPSI